MPMGMRYASGHRKYFGQFNIQVNLNIHQFSTNQAEKEKEKKQTRRMFCLTQHNTKQTKSYKRK